MDKICKKTNKPIYHEVKFGNAYLGKQLDFDQLQKCIFCEGCNLVFRGKLQRRQGI
jgi:hypothetical protein